MCGRNYVKLRKKSPTQIVQEHVLCVGKNRKRDIPAFLDCRRKNIQFIQFRFFVEILNLCDFDFLSKFQF